MVPEHSNFQSCRIGWTRLGLVISPTVKNVSQLLHFSFSVFQIEEFRRLRTHVKGAELLEGSDGILGDNFRPTQPLSDRVIRAAFQ